MVDPEQTYIFSEQTMELIRYAMPLVGVGIGIAATPLIENLKDKRIRTSAKNSFSEECESLLKTHATIIKDFGSVLNAVVLDRMLRNHPYFAPISVNFPKEIKFYSSKIVEENLFTSFSKKERTWVAEILTIQSSINPQIAKYNHPDTQFNEIDFDRLQNVARHFAALRVHIELFLNPKLSYKSYSPLPEYCEQLFANEGYSLKESKIREFIIKNNPSLKDIPVYSN